jgi:hypothetical protein
VAGGRSRCLQNGFVLSSEVIMGRTRLCVAAALFFLSAATASAKELQVIGRATVAIGARDRLAVRSDAMAGARRAAVTAAIEKVLGPGASRDPRVGGKVNAVLDQVPDGAFADARSAAASGEYQVTVTLVLDDKEFRTLLSDLGIAVNTASVRASSILMVMDEFLTTPRDLKAPLEELLEFRSEVGASLRDNSAATTSRLDASATSTRASASFEGHAAARDVHVSGESVRSRSERQVTAEASHAVVDVAAEQHDNQYYRKLVRYQPQGGAPEKVSQMYNALSGQLQDYDLRVLDNDLFRSRYFKDAPLTLEQLQGSEALSKYASFARTDANADFFLVGTAIIIDAGRNLNTGDVECTGVASFKTYATVDGESIASETFSEVSSGRNVNDCAGNLTRKLAAIGGPVLGARVQEYWKRRATYGRELIVSLKGANVPLMARVAFTRAVKAVPGVEADVQRASTSTLHQLVVTYRGADPFDQALAVGLSENPTFATLDSRTDGNQVVLCLGPCSQVEKTSGATP